MADMRALQDELQAVLLRLAACQIDLTEWQAWWAAHSAAVKKLISPGDFSRLNRAPSLYGPNSFMEKCQVGAERYLQKMQIPFSYSGVYARAAAEEQRIYNQKKAKEMAENQREAQARLERNRRDPEGLPFYCDFVDIFVKRAKQKPYLPAELAAFSPEQQALVADWLQDERYIALSDVLADLDWQIICNELELHQHGFKMPYMTYDDLLHDFTCRMQGDEWPKDTTEE